jgi:gliding motility-associated-like protein
MNINSLKTSLLTLVTTLILYLFQSTPLCAQTDLGPFELQPRNLNPLRPSFKFPNQPTPVILDRDNDGDFDVVVAVYAGPGNGDPHFKYIKNIGSVTKPVFIEGHPNENPFWLIPSTASFGLAPTPSFSDIDQDGDVDMLVGVENGLINYYKHNGTNFLQYQLQSGASNPFNSINVGSFASPVFVDVDNDGDDDVIVGSSFAPLSKSIHYFVNEGTGNFSPGILSGINPTLNAVTPALLDVDGDGLLDIVVGDMDGNLYFFKRTGSTSFSEQTGAANPFNGIDKGDHASPAAADFDNDGDSDLIVGAQKAYTVDIAYFENKGNGIFQEKTSFENPFDGVDTSVQPSPFITDVDGDLKQDLIINDNTAGTGQLRFFKNVDQKFVEQTGTENPFSSLVVSSDFVPSIIDLDGDGDGDLVGGGNDSQDPITYFKNENGVYVKQSFAGGPFSSIPVIGGKTDFVDIDTDGDVDLFIADTDVNTGTHFIRFYKNTGTPQSPVFIEQAGTANLLHSVSEEYTLYPRFTDIDHDDDLDALIGEGGGVVENDTGNEFLLYENTGTRATPEFTFRGNLITPGLNASDPSPAYLDIDDDGDLDLFVGSDVGAIHYYKNNNSAPVIVIDQTPIVGNPEIPIVISDDISLADTDNDPIVKARVEVTDFEGDAILSFTPLPGITGNFEATTGVLIISGKGSRSAYQAVLRTVTFTFTGNPNGRKGANKRIQDISRTIQFQIFDADFTTPAAVTKSITIPSATVNTPPVINPQTIAITYGQLAAVDLSSLVSDDDGNIDLTTLTIVQVPSSGAPAMINTSNQLVINYDGLNFSGTETVRVEVCDNDGACAQNTITIIVSANPDSEIEIFNAVAPHSTGDNKFMRILNLPQNSNVSIYNRWGDVVFETQSYENTHEGNSFKGLNKRGEALPSGNYFYKIEISTNKKTLTGYIALIQ